MLLVFRVDIISLLYTLQRLYKTHDREYRSRMGILLLIVTAFALMGGIQVVLYSAFLGTILFGLLVLPSMVISKIFRV